MKIRILLGMLLMLAVTGAWAATRPNIVVEGVQLPAWVEHPNGGREALGIGLALGNKDRVYTGPGSRVVLRLAEGSLVKLGENGILELDELGQRKVSLKDVVTASLDVLKGAFRFTSQTIYKFRGERDVQIRAVTITAGIRGTDVWAKADATRDIVCLIDGTITVTHANNAFTMDQPMSFYIVPKTGPAQPVGPVSREQFGTWQTETEFTAGAGVQQKGGKWRIYLAEAPNQEEALALYDRLRLAGYAAQIRPLKGESSITYHVRIANLVSEQDANTLAARIKTEFGIAALKVSR